MSRNVIKVLHVLHSFDHGGLENGIVNLINRSSENLSHELCLLSEGGDFLGRLKDPVYYELHRKPGHDLSLIPRIRRIIRRSGARIVHTRNWGAFDGVAAAALSPGVVLLHGEHGRDIQDPDGRIRRRNLLRRMLAFRVALFTTVCDDLARWLTGTVGIPKRKVVVIPNGVDTERYRPRKEPGLRSLLGFRQDDLLIGSIGRLDPVKNHAGLIRALEVIRRRNPRVRLILAGEGPEREALVRLIGQLGLEDSVLLAGYREDVDRVYPMLDVYVLNSIAEGMSNTLLEAMASGVPAVCTATGGNAEVVRDGITGRMVPVGNTEALVSALLLYIENPELRVRHGESAVRHVEESFSVQGMCQKYDRLYEAAAGASLSGVNLEPGSAAPTR